MRNLCVILADQLNQEISSLNDFDKDLDEVLICEFKEREASAVKFTVPFKVPSSP